MSINFGQTERIRLRQTDDQMKSAQKKKPTN